jgi:acyl carrier protein
MAQIEEFVKNIEAAIEEIEPGSLAPETSFKELQHWSSMQALILMAMFETEYNVSVTGNQLRNCNTVQDLFNLLPK